MKEENYKLFSSQAGLYAEFRPTYPVELFNYLAQLCASHKTAWDCATGNGQAALRLAEHFDHVVASDASIEQLSRRQVNPRLHYFMSVAEHVPLEDQSVDLVTVAQAAHWFNLDAYYSEVRRLVKPGGVVALWCYEMLRIKGSVDEIVARLYHDITGPYWSPRRKLIEDRYRSLPFPFEEETPPAFTMTADWTLANLVGFVSSWSATQKFTREKGYSPLRVIQEELAEAWGPPELVRRSEWDLFLRVGRV